MYTVRDVLIGFYFVDFLLYFVHENLTTGQPEEEKSCSAIFTV